MAANNKKSGLALIAQDRFGNRFGSGKEEIRTLGTIACTLAFQASPIDHSGTFPR
jgi:hypothetical protein